MRMVEGHGGGHGTAEDTVVDMAVPPPRLAHRLDRANMVRLRIMLVMVHQINGRPGFVQGGSAGESLDSYSTGGNRSYTSHGLAKQRAKDAAGNQDCPGDPRPNCGCATGLRLVNGLCAHED